MSKTAHDPLWFLPPNREIGPFRFSSVLGVGGKTLLLSVVDQEGRPFGMKIPVQESYQDSTWRGRFDREVQILRQLAGPAFPMLRAFGRYNAGDHRNIPYIVTALPIGPTLREVIAQRRATAVRPDIHGAPFLLRSLAEALSEAHERGIIHRNLRPDKIAISGQQVQILDFLLGLAHQDDDEDGEELGANFGGDLTRDKDFLGTPDYIAPEQARSPHNVDARADLYSLGLILFEYLTYDRPFGQSQSVLDALSQHLTRDVPPPSSRIGEIPRDLDQIILKLTRRRPDERYQSADEVIRAVDDMMQARRGATVTHVCYAPASGKLGPYRIREATAVTGKTALLRAEDSRGRSFVAKVPTQSGAKSPSYLEHFRREVDILHEVAGPLFPVLRASGTYDTADYQGLPFLVVDTPSGLTIREVIDQRRTRSVGPDIEGAPRLLRKLALLLGEVHAKGIFPCHVRPDSVAVHEGNVQLLEFVLAQGADNESVSAAGATSALASYAAPEQLARDQVLDERVDLFALGVLLYEYLTFELPYGLVTSRQEALLRLMSQTPLLPSARNPAIPPALEALVMRLLARNRDDRPHGAYAVAREALAL
jgi:serine/threonine protein kinase